MIDGVSVNLVVRFSFLNKLQASGNTVSLSVRLLVSASSKFQGFAS